MVQSWGFSSLKISTCNFDLTLFLSVFGHKIGVLKSPALFQGKKLQVAYASRSCASSTCILCRA